jgi:hypothetical protein
MLTYSARFTAETDQFHEKSSFYTSESRHFAAVIAHICCLWLSFAKKNMTSLRGVTTESGSKYDTSFTLFDTESIYVSRNVFCNFPKRKKSFVHSLNFHQCYSCRFEVFKPPSHTKQIYNFRMFT